MSEIRMEDFPSNSFESKKEEKREEAPKLEKKIQGSATIKKKSLGVRFIESIIGEDPDSVRNYVISDVLIPGIKQIISDVISTGVDMLFFGEKRGNTRYQKSSPYGHVSYQKFYDEQNSRNIRDAHPGYSMPEIIVDNYVEAQTTLYNLQEVIERYGQASVARLYDIVGITSNFTDNRYGWESLSGAGSRRLRDGRYLLVLPPTKVLD